MRKIIKLISVATCLIFVSAALFAQGDITKKVLDNGVTIVHKYMPDSPLVTIQIRVEAGLSNEGEYAGSGISHFLEHLLFKGAHGRTSKELREQIKKMGGTINGSTGLDSAEYHITVPNENFQEALHLLAGLVMEPVFTKDETEKERNVILKEINLRKDDPVSRRMELLFSQSYRDHVYKYPVIGYEDRFKELTSEEVISYHSKVYRPGRIVLGFAGGVPPDIAVEVAGKELSGYARGEAWVPAVESEPAQLDARDASFEAEITLGYLGIAFHTTSMYSPDMYPADVLSILIGQGQGSRLYRSLVRDKELLYSLSSVNYTPKYPGLFIITGIGDPEKLQAAEEEIFRVIEELKEQGVREEELERAKKITISSYLHSLERIASVTSSMTSSELFTGDPAFYEKYVGGIEKVDARAVQDALDRYLVRRNSTTVRLLPPGFEKAETAADPGKSEEEDRSVTLDNGMRVFILRRPQNPIVSATIVFPAGLRAETSRTNGISNLTSSLLLKGTKTRDESMIVPVFEDMGASISTFSGMNSAGARMDVMSRDLDEALEVFADVMRNPAFPQGEIDKKKKKVIAYIREQDTDVFDRGFMALKKAMYASHPYAMRPEGEVETVGAMTREDIQGFHMKYFAPDAAVLTVVGDVNIESALEAVKKAFGTWNAKAETITTPEVVPPPEKQSIDIDMTKEQALYAAGFIGAKATDRQRFALSLVASVLSGSDGLLFDGLREEQGLVYTSNAFSVAAVDPGYFALYAATSEKNVSRAGRDIVSILKKIVSGGISEEDLDLAKKKMMTSHALSIETNSSLSLQTALDELYGQGFRFYTEYPGRIDSVTSEEVKKAASGVLDLDRITEVVVHSRE